MVKKKIDDDSPFVTNLKMIHSLESYYIKAKHPHRNTNVNLATSK